eukprot:4740805-Amphidinium_carterae.1
MVMLYYVPTIDAMLEHCSAWFVLACLLNPKAAGGDTKEAGYSFAIVTSTGNDEAAYDLVRISYLQLKSQGSLSHDQAALNEAERLINEKIQEPIELDQKGKMFPQRQIHAQFP